MANAEEGKTSKQHVRRIWLSDDFVNSCFVLVNEEYAKELNEQYACANDQIEFDCKLQSKLLYI